MDRALAGMPFRDFAEPGDTVIHGDLVSVPHVYGMSLGQARSVLYSAGFRPVATYPVSSSLPVGLVVGTQPSYRALRGSSILIYTSSGAAPKPPKKKW
jgi:beta-lactam-binding protein with PASTA domain